MNMHPLAAVFLALAVQSASAVAEERPALRDVSVIRIANYGTPSTVIKDRAQVNAILDELRQLRSKAWRAADTKLSCYATMVLLRGEKTLTLLRIGAEQVVERAPGKGQSTYSLAAGPAELPGIHALLAGIPPPKDCK
jgi:hypothetical protein